MPRFQLLPGAVGLDFEGGGSVKADRRGVVTVSEEAAARIRGSAAFRRYDALVEVAPLRSASRRTDRSCGHCHFTPWPWQAQTTCPRCGEQME